MNALFSNLLILKMLLYLSDILSKTLLESLFQILIEMCFIEVL